MRKTEGWKLWLILAITLLLLVGYQHWTVPEAYIVQYGRRAALQVATAAAFRQFIALLVPVVLVLVAGLALDRLSPPTPDGQNIR